MRHRPARIPLFECRLPHLAKTHLLGVAGQSLLPIILAPGSWTPMISENEDRECRYLHRVIVLHNDSDALTDRDIKLCYFVDDGGDQLIQPTPQSQC
jgi:hypothetical protein